MIDQAKQTTVRNPVALIGWRFGTWTILAMRERKGFDYSTDAQCDCGYTTKIPLRELFDGRAHGCQPRETPPRGDGSERQREVMALKATGMTQAAIAERLGLSPGYVCQLVKAARSAP